MDSIKKKQKLIYAAVAFVYALITLIGVINHEIWYDEAQAWCVARDNDIFGIVNHLKFEGHPILWYLIILPFAKMGLSCVSIGFISWAISVLTVGLILFKMKLSFKMKLFTVFSCGFLFYNSITSRPYCVIVLLLVLISLIYPRRKEHPVMFGVLVALLANTHICMSGLVGFLGIQMIYELFTEWKTSRCSRNFCRLGGLGIAGVGVVALVLPLFLSLQSNHAVTDSPLTIGNVIPRLFNSFDNIGKNIAIQIPGLNSMLASIIAIFLIAMFILMRHYRKGLIAMLMFTAFYIIATQLIYTVMQPTRAITFVYTLLLIYYTAKENETPNKSKQKDNSKADSKILKQITDSILKIDACFDKGIVVIFSVIMCISSVRGIYWYVKDVIGNYSLSVVTADYIREELPEGSVFVVDNYHFVPISAELPEYYFYFESNNEFLTYAPNISTKDMKTDKEKTKNDLEKYTNIYRMRFVADEDGDALFSESFSPDIMYISRAISITEFSFE